MPDTSQTTLSLYTLAVEMADRVSARRGTANQFYLTLETFILGVPATFGWIDQGSATSSASVSGFAAVGILVGIVWWLQLRSYRHLNRAKFRVILDLEREMLPVALFEREWEHLKHSSRQGWRGRYVELGWVEAWVPWTFVLVNVGLIVNANL